MKIRRGLLRNRRLALSLLAAFSAISAGFSGFYGGRAVQMIDDLGDGADWWAAGQHVDWAVVLFAMTAAFASAFLFLMWTLVPHVEETRS